MKIFTVTVTDGSGDNGYGVLLKKEASVWVDNSSAGHEISSITQSGNVNSSGGGLACGDGAGGTTLMLNGADWGMANGAKGGALRQHDPGGPVERDWSWEVTTVTTA
jgi:hypothetical protein